MKKTIRMFALLLTMIFVLTACGGKEPKAPESPAAGTDAPAAGTEAPAAGSGEPAAAEPEAAEPAPAAAAEPEEESLASGEKNGKIRYEGDGFDTPEDAVRYYLEGLRNMDVQQMLGAFAWETRMSRFSVENYYYWLNSYSPTMIPRYLPENEMISTANLEAIRMLDSRFIYYSIKAFIYPDGYDMGEAIGPLDDKQGESFLQGFKYDRLDKLAGMSNIRFLTPDSVTGGKYSSEQNQKNMKARYTDIYRADEITDVVAVADIGDETIAVIPAVARYGSKWYIVTLSSITSSILGLGQYEKGFTVVPADLSLLLATMPAEPAAQTDISAGGVQPIRYEGDGYDTPEDAVRAYLEGLRNLDVQQMLGAFAWETQNSRYLIEAELLRLNTYIPSMSPGLFPKNSLLTSANLEEIRANETYRIYATIGVYVTPESYEQGMTFAPIDSEEGKAFLQGFRYDRLEKLAGLTNIRFLTPDLVTKDHFSTPTNQKNFEEQNAKYGADQVVDIVAVADAGDEFLMVIPTVARYGDRWYLVSLNSNTSSLLGINYDTRAFILGNNDFAEAFTAEYYAPEPTVVPMTADRFREEAQQYFDIADAYIAAAETGIRNIRGYIAQTLANIEAWKTAGGQSDDAETIVRNMEKKNEEAEGEQGKLQQYADKLKGMTGISGSETEEELESLLREMGIQIAWMKRTLRKIVKIDQLESASALSAETYVRKRYEEVLRVIGEDNPGLDLGEQFVPEEISLP